MRCVPFFLGDLATWVLTKQPLFLAYLATKKNRGCQLAGVSEEELLALLEQGQKIEAIKLYRERTGAGLKDAKDAVEAIGLKHGLMSKRAGCAAVLLAFLPVLLGFYFLTPR